MKNVKKALLILSVSGSPAFADKCEPGQYIIFDASCSSFTARVQIIGEREISVMTRTSLTKLNDGSVQCSFSGQSASLDKIEPTQGRPLYTVHGC